MSANTSIVDMRASVSRGFWTILVPQKQIKKHPVMQCT